MPQSWMLISPMRVSILDRAENDAHVATSRRRGALEKPILSASASYLLDCFISAKHHGWTKHPSRQLQASMRERALYGNEESTANELSDEQCDEKRLLLGNAPGAGFLTKHREPPHPPGKGAGSIPILTTATAGRRQYGIQRLGSDSSAFLCYYETGPERA